MSDALKPDPPSAGSLRDYVQHGDRCPMTLYCAIKGSTGRRIESAPDDAVCTCGLSILLAAAVPGSAPAAALIAKWEGEAGRYDVMAREAGRERLRYLDYATMLRYCATQLQCLIAAVPGSARPPETPKAEVIARVAHATQRDHLTGRPYIEHIERVVALVDGDDAKAVAWLHDVLEDTEMTFSDLLEAGISECVVDAVRLLTRCPTVSASYDFDGRQDYGTYIDYVRTSGNALAIAVKVADLLDHLRPASLHVLTPSMRERYPKALAALAAGAPVSPLLEELKNIANANPRTWDEDMRHGFQQWAQNRARAAIAKAEGAAGGAPVSPCQGDCVIQRAGCRTDCMGRVFPAPPETRDVTAACRFGNPDDELLPLTQCACGARFKAWDVNLSVYEDDPRQMDCCGRRLYFRNGVQILEAAAPAQPPEAP